MDVDGHGDPGGTRYDVRVVFVALAGPEELAAAEWWHDQAGLMTRAAPVWPVRRPAHSSRRRISAGSRKRCCRPAAFTGGGPWPDEVVDPESGLNVMLFPADEGSLDLCRRYSNRPDLTKRLVDVLQLIEAGDQSGLPGEVKGRERGDVADRGTLVQRLGEDGIAKLIAEYLAGESSRLLAERYGISQSGVKKLLIRHRVRRQRSQPGRRSKP